MQSTDNARKTLDVLIDRKDPLTAVLIDFLHNAPVVTKPTNAEIVRYLHRVSMHFAMFKPTMDQSLSFHQFEFHTDVGGTPHVFEAKFVDLKDFEVVCTTTKDAFAKYERAKALTSLLYDSCFCDVEAFAVACRNALGDNLETFDLAGSIFVNGQCVDELLSVLEEKANEERELATEVQKLKNGICILTQIVTMLCDNPALPRS